MLVYLFNIVRNIHNIRFGGLQVAAPEIAMIKVAAPLMAERVIDRAIQVCC